MTGMWLAGLRKMSPWFVASTSACTSYGIEPVISAVAASIMVGSGARRNLRAHAAAAYAALRRERSQLVGPPGHGYPALPAPVSTWGFPFVREDRDAEATA